MKFCLVILRIPYHIFPRQLARFIQKTITNKCRVINYSMWYVRNFTNESQNLNVLGMIPPTLCSMLYVQDTDDYRECFKLLFLLSLSFYLYSSSTLYSAGRHPFTFKSQSFGEYIFLFITCSKIFLIYNAINYTMSKIFC